MSNSSNDGMRQCDDDDDNGTRQCNDNNQGAPTMLPHTTYQPGPKSLALQHQPLHTRRVRISSSTHPPSYALPVEWCRTAILATSVPSLGETAHFYFPFSFILSCFPQHITHPPSTSEFKFTIISTHFFTFPLNLIISTST